MIERIPGVAFEHVMFYDLGSVEVDPDSLASFIRTKERTCGDKPSMGCNDLVIGWLFQKNFKKALELLPNYPNPWYNLRDIYLQTGEHESAKSAMDSAASISGTRAARFESDG